MRKLNATVCGELASYILVSYKIQFNNEFSKEQKKEINIKLSMGTINLNWRHKIESHALIDKQKFNFFCSAFAKG